MNLKQKNGFALMTRGSTGISATRANGLAQEREGTTILQSVLAALNEGKISEAVDQVDERFTFTDHALDLEFTDKGRLIEFFQKTRELFPDTVVEVVSSFQCGDHAVAEWKRPATTETVPYGSKGFRFPISLRGTSIVCTENGRITDWSDYYDKNRSWRFSLAAFFTEWIEY
jgi:ketosteroid isomerase-like protein